MLREQSKIRFLYLRIEERINITVLLTDELEAATTLDLITVTVNNHNRKYGRASSFENVIGNPDREVFNHFTGQTQTVKGLEWNFVLGKLHFLQFLSVDETILAAKVHHNYSS